MLRKQFLQISSAAAGALVTHRLLAAPATPKDSLRISGVELAIATICTDGFGNRHHEPAMEYIPKLGYRNVELNLWYPDQITPNYVAGLKKRCANAGLNPVSVQSTGFGVEGRRNGVMKDVSHKLLMMNYAKQLDCNIVKFTGSRRGTQGGLKAIIEVCKELAPAAEELGVLLTLENHTGNNLETIEDYESIFEQIDSPNIGLCLDTGHFEGSGIQLSEVLKRLHARTLHVDLKDCKAFGKGHDTVPFGSGTTDFDEFLSQLTDTGYRGYFVIEQAWSEPKGNWKQDLKSAYQRFAKWERS